MREDQYMAFGLSGEQGRSYMIGGDVVVAFYDSERGTFRVEDYYMTATAQVQCFLCKSLTLHAILFSQGKAPTWGLRK
jgi:hypothetical protein